MKFLQAKQLIPLLKADNQYDLSDELESSIEKIVKAGTEEIAEILLSQKLTDYIRAKGLDANEVKVSHHESNLADGFDVPESILIKTAYVRTQGAELMAKLRGYGYNSITQTKLKSLNRLCDDIEIDVTGLKENDVVVKNKHLEADDELRSFKTYIDNTVIARELQSSGLIAPEKRNINMSENDLSSEQKSVSQSSVPVAQLPENSLSFKK